MSTQACNGIVLLAYGMVWLIEHHYTCIYASRAIHCKHTVMLNGKLVVSHLLLHFVDKMFESLHWSNMHRINRPINYYSFTEYIWIRHWININLFSCPFKLSAILIDYSQYTTFPHSFQTNSLYKTEKCGWWQVFLLVYFMILLFAYPNIWNNRFMQQL